MAGCAGGGEADLSVIRIRRAVVIRRVAGVAIRGNGSVVIVGVALSAWNSKLRPRQREGTSRVVECRRAPAAGRVAQAAIGRETRGNMIGTGSPGEIRLMTGVTCGRR